MAEASSSLVFDTNAWFTMGPMAWLRLATTIACGGGLLAGAGILVVACLWAAVGRGTPLGSRIVSLALGLGVGGATWWVGRAVFAGTVATLFAADQDFVRIRITADRFTLEGGREDGRARAATELVEVRVACVAEEDAGEHTYTCLRATEVAWADGTVSRSGDVVEGGLSPCGRALERLEEQARALAAAGGRRGAVVVTGTCGR